VKWNEIGVVRLSDSQIFRASCKVWFSAGCRTKSSSIEFHYKYNWLFLYQCNSDLCCEGNPCIGFDIRSLFERLNFWYTQISNTVIAKTFDRNSIRVHYLISFRLVHSLHLVALVVGWQPLPTSQELILCPPIQYKHLWYWHHISDQLFLLWILSGHLKLS